MPSVIGDNERIAEIHALGFDKGWSVSEIDSLLQQKEISILVAREIGGGDKPVVGFIIFRSKALESASAILSVAVDPFIHRLGIGSLLIRQSIRQLQANRISQVFLEVDDSNQPAIKMYRKTGFQAVGSRPYYHQYEDSSRELLKVTALVMCLDLGPLKVVCEK
ncbi:N-acetyltransferase [Candidatus Endowatersipora endosymbiont of Watersipora subatra]|uniref:N-acetyltransferase n=1 Tax=Candidatus Endowatersipora endosymbiont of Watersipora subatra TaxID=3077946 RepID=UPI00312C7ECD